MSNNKLTVDRAVKYWGAEVMYPDGSIHRVNTRTLEYIECEEDCKLPLTPLPAITDEHAIEVADIINLHYPFSEPLRFDCGLVKMGYQLQPNKSSSLYNYDVIDLLRSLGYDCDNAIAEGWAIDKNQIQATNKNK